jgi:putative ABC transport system permease protein
VASNRFNMSLFGLFAVIAVSLTIVGVFGVMNYAVTQRTQEIGIRMALGAQPGQVRALILKQGLVLSGAGLVIGLGSCLLVTHWLASMLFSVSPKDPVILAAVALVLAAVALLTCYIPARRATKVDPIIALKYE